MTRPLAASILPALFLSALFVGAAQPAAADQNTCTNILECICPPDGVCGECEFTPSPPNLSCVICVVEICPGGPPGGNCPAGQVGARAGTMNFCFPRTVPGAVTTTCPGGRRGIYIDYPTPTMTAAPWSPEDRYLCVSHAVNTCGTPSATVDVRSSFVGNRTYCFSAPPPPPCGLTPSTWCGYPVPFVERTPTTPWMCGGTGVARIWWSPTGPSMDVCV